MTLLLTSWQPFNHSFGWSPMEPALPPSIPSDYGSHKVGEATSETESIPTSSGSGKKRSSRAGTRSVSTLSAAQLERKRANDRDAQRAIRQRTKDHIDGLEKTINDLRTTQEATEKLLAATQNHNREIVEENAYLRSKLGEAGIPVGIASYESKSTSCSLLIGERLYRKLTMKKDHIRFEPSQFPLQDSSVGQIASSANQSDEVTSTPRSNLSLATSQSSEPQHALWQQQQSAVQSAPANLENASMMQIGSNITNWRSHDGLHNANTGARQIQPTSPEQAQLRYDANVTNQDAHWDAKPPAAIFQGSQVPPQYIASAQQRQQQQSPQQYQQSAAPTAYAPQSTPQQQSFQTPGPTPSEFQSLTIASPVGYQVSHQQSSLPQPTHYMMPASDVSRTMSHPEIASQQPMMHGQSALNSTYDPTRITHQYAQSSHQQLPLQHPPDDTTYPPGQYPG